jgi:hypothetical protein
MARVPGAWIGLLLPGLLAAQTPLRTVTGIVRQVGDSLPLVGAEVLLGTRSTTTNERGRFRIDSVAPGVYTLVVRQIGSRPLRTRLEVSATSRTDLALYLLPAPQLLPTLIVEGRRTGLYGSVGDTAYRPLAGARVIVLGSGGGERVTDSLGRFAFHDLPGGAYMVRVTMPGHLERRLVIDLPKGKGRELTFLLPPGRDRITNLDRAALADLDRRLSFELRNSRMTRSEMARYGSMALCDVPRIRTMAGDPTTVLLNGEQILRGVSLCAWRMDEVDLVEFGSELRLSTDLARGLGGQSLQSRPSRRGSPRSRPRYVIIWERR